jgi:hypothetical protein
LALRVRLRIRPPSIPAAVAVALALGCATLQPFQVPLSPHLPADACPYRNVYVVPENQSSGCAARRAEGDRRRFVLAYVDGLVRGGAQVVGSREEAWWVIHSWASVGDDRRTYVGIDFQEELRLARHVYLFSVEDERFPFRGDLGSGYGVVLGSRIDRLPWTIRLGEAAASSWDQEREQIEAACRARARTMEAGWESVEALRLRLVQEMKLVRERRRRESQTKDPEIGGDGGTGSRQRKSLTIQPAGDQ